MEALTKRFLKIGIYFTIVVGLLQFAVVSFILKQPYLVIYPAIFIYFLAFSAVAINFIVKSTKKRQAAFVNTFMINITVKMLLSLTLIVIYLYFNKHYLYPVLLTFLVVYLLYLSLEVIFLVRNLKK